MRIERGSGKLNQRGVTQIELAITLVILGLLITVGIPSSERMILNAQIRAAADQLNVGLALARGEALRRNRPVEFLLSKDSVASANVGQTDIVSVGSAWMVRVFREVPKDELDDFVQSGMLSGQKIEASIGLDDADPKGRLVFSGLGTLNIAGTVHINVRPIEVEKCKKAGGEQTCLSVELSPGGAMRTCDPAVVDVADPRACVL